MGFINGKISSDQEQGLYVYCIHYNGCGPYDTYYDEVKLV